jgi:hypothetical protein
MLGGRRLLRRPLFLSAAFSRALKGPSICAAGFGVDPIFIDLPARPSIHFLSVDRLLTTGSRPIG